MEIQSCFKNWLEAIVRKISIRKNIIKDIIFRKF